VALRDLQFVTGATTCRKKGITMSHARHSARFVYTLIAFALLAMLALAVGARAQAQSDQRCFPETGQCMSGRIREFWEQNGGLPVFGFPITPQRAETTASGTFQSQWFERTRLELHPENAPPYDVLLGRAGDIRLRQQGRDWYTFPKADPSHANVPGDCVYYPETQHSVCGLFLTAYRSYGLSFPGVSGISAEESLALFGMPLSEPMVEELEDGKTYVVQWFERVRFEEHPENVPPYNVLFGRLGADILNTYMNPPITPTPAPPTPTPGVGPGGCMPKMTFVEDVTVPNGTTLQPNAEFVRTWRVRNDGTCYWDSNYRLVFSKGDQMGGPAWVPVPNTEPGARVNLSVPLIAPPTPGNYRGYWVMQASNGATFDGLVVEIDVAAAPAPTATAAAPAPTATAAATPMPSPVGPLWRWQGTALNDGTRIAVADPSRYTLQLRPDGSIAVKADCNQIGGAYSLNGNSLTIALGPSTQVACPSDSQADVYVQQLAAVVGYVYDNAALILNMKMDSGGMRFLR
jgi:heat shock protein HslJ